MPDPELLTIKIKNNYKYLENSITFTSSFNQLNQKIMETTKTNDFYCQPPYVAERTGDYDKQNVIAAKWVYTTQQQEGNGNVNSNISLDQNGKLQFKNYMDRPDDNIPMYRLISPALALYRLISIFFHPPLTYDGYKRIWEYNLVHKATGTQIHFSEWKGAFGVWMVETDYKKLPRSLSTDLFELIEHLISDKCAHPYDNLVAGSVA